LARENGLNKIFALSTQTFKWFQSKANFVEGELSELPQFRQESATASGRNSKVLFKSLE
jgi:N-acetylglutamate synthase-like GNAT family acetyltransferase